jgi:hypothetical protein
MSYFQARHTLYGRLQRVMRLSVCGYVYVCICFSHLGNWGIKLISRYSIQKDLYTGTAVQYKWMILKRKGNELKIVQIRLCYYTWNIIKFHLRHLLVVIAA